MNEIYIDPEVLSVRELHGHMLAGGYRSSSIPDRLACQARAVLDGHRASLLHYIGANGVESYRQIVPLNAPAIAQCLVRAGADVNARANIYGGSTALNLVLTSAQPPNAGVSNAIADVLRMAGAR